MSRLKAAPEAGLVFSEAMVQLGGRFTSATEFQGYDPLLYRCSLMAFALLRRYAEVRPSGELRSRAWRLAFRASSVGDGGATAGNVKLLLPPRQSRGISFVSLGTCARAGSRKVGTGFRKKGMLKHEAGAG